MRRQGGQHGDGERHWRETNKGSKVGHGFHPFKESSLLTKIFQDVNTLSIMENSDTIGCWKGHF
jgi:hypothetical protein